MLANSSVLYSSFWIRDLGFTTHQNYPSNLETSFMFEMRFACKTTQH